MIVGGLSLWSLGALLGLRHALEPDHLAAVSTLVSGKASSRAAIGLGAAWGLGHTLALVAVATALAAAQASLPSPVATAFELGVGVMLVLLGARAIGRGLTLARTVPASSAGDTARTASRAGASRWRSLLVGVVHGLAGSGALTAMVAAELSSAWSRVAYVGLFGISSMLGMAGLSGLAGMPLGHLGRRPGVQAAIGMLAGAVALVLGATWIWREALRLTAA